MLFYLGGGVPLYQNRLTQKQPLKRLETNTFTTTKNKRNAMALIVVNPEKKVVSTTANIVLLI